MSGRKVSLFIPVGLILLSTALLLHNFVRGNYSDFATGLLMGMSVTMMIGGLLKRGRGTST